MDASRIEETAAIAQDVIPVSLQRTLATCLPPGTAFEMQMPERPAVRIGDGAVKFRVAANSTAAVSAVKSLDEIRIAEAYLGGDLDIEGDLLAAFALRNALTNTHLLPYLWSTYGQPLFHGQTTSDKKWIAQHYDIDGDFHLQFLDDEFRCYSHGYFENKDESLERAIERKLTTAVEMARIKPGMRVLDIGAGWGAFTEFAGKRGAQVTSLTISKDSEAYCSELIRREQLPCHVVREHFLEYDNPERFDAIVNLGGTEHLPDYPATLRQYAKLLKPGGRVYLDASASPTKYPFSRFILKYIYPGNETPLHLPSYLDSVCESPFELCSVHNDRVSYMLTARHWAEKLDCSHQTVTSRWGESVYRRFRLYLWGCVHVFATDDMTAYHWVLQLTDGHSGRKTPRCMWSGGSALRPGIVATFRIGHFAPRAHSSSFWDGWAPWRRKKAALVGGESPASPCDVGQRRRRAFAAAWIFVVARRLVSVQQVPGDELPLNPDLAKFRELQFLNRCYVLPPVTLAIAVSALGWALQRWFPGLHTSPLQMLLWGYLVSTVLLYHGTFVVNSLAHVIGRQRFATKDDSKNSLLIAIVTLGEGWHNNHHFVPSSERQGFYWWEVDVTHYMLKILSWFGVVWELKRPPQHIHAMVKRQAT